MAVHYDQAPLTHAWLIDLLDFLDVMVTYFIRNIYIYQAFLMSMNYIFRNIRWRELSFMEQ